MLSLDALANVLPCETVYDDYAHRLFISSNETQQAQTLEALAQKTITANTLMGVSGFFTLNMAANIGKRQNNQRNIEAIILVDRSVRAEHFWNATKGIVTESADRITVIENVKKLLKNEQSRYFSGAGTDKAEMKEALKLVKNDIKEGTSWLSNNVKFQKVKQVFDANRFQFLRLDFFEKGSFSELAQAMQTHHLAVDTLYLSNIWLYALSIDDRQNYLDNVIQIVAPETVVVHAQSEDCMKCYPARQSLHSNRDLASIIPLVRSIFCKSCSEELFQYCLEHIQSQSTTPPMIGKLFTTLLLDGQADINAQDGQGNTALMWAAKKGDTIIIKMLLEYKADQSIRNLKGKNALTFAMLSKVEAINLLEGV